MTLVKPPVCSGRLSHPLAGDVGQVVIFVIRFVVLPHDKDNLEPFCSQGSKSTVMGVSFSPLVAIVSVGPLASVQRHKSKPVHRVSQPLIAGKTKPYSMTLATRSSHRNHSRLGLKVPKGLPSSYGVSELSANRWHGASALSSRQRRKKLSRRQRDEKTFDLVVVGVDRFNRGLQLIEQHFQQLCLSSDHVFGNQELRLMERLPQLVTATLAEVMFTSGEALPLLTAKFGQCHWGGIALKKIARDLRFEIAKDLQRSRIVLFESDLELLEQSCVVALHSVLVPSQQFKLLSRLRVGLKSSHVGVVGPNKLREHVSIKTIALRLTHAKPIPGPIHRLGIDRIHLHPMIQKKIHNVHLVHLVRPIHSQIISLHLLVLLSSVFPIPKAVNGRFALDRASRGQLSIEPLVPFSHWSGQSAPDPQQELGPVVLVPASS